MLGVCPRCGRARGVYQLGHVFLIVERLIGAELVRSGSPGGQQSSSDGLVLAARRCWLCYITALSTSVFLSLLCSSHLTLRGLSACLFLDYSPLKRETSLALQTIDKSVCVVAVWQEL